MLILHMSTALWTKYSTVHLGEHGLRSTLRVPIFTNYNNSQLSTDLCTCVDNSILVIYEPAFESGRIPQNIGVTHNVTCNYVTCSQSYPQAVDAVDTQDRLKVVMLYGFCHVTREKFGTKSLHSYPQITRLLHRFLWITFLRDQ